MGACALFLDLKFTFDLVSFKPEVDGLDKVYNGLFFYAGYKRDYFNLPLGEDGYRDD